MSSSISTMTPSSDAAPVPPGTPTIAAGANSALAPVATPSSSASSAMKRTVVTAKRKDELLLEARAERKRWIRNIPLPYDPELLANHATDGKAEDEVRNRLWNSREGLDQFQNSIVFRDGLLQGATSILSELYGIGSILDDSGEGNDNGEDGNKNVRKDLPNRPLSVDDVASRVERLTKPFLAEKEEDGQHKRPNSIGGKEKKRDDTPNNDDGDGVQENRENNIRDDRYKDVRTAYEEFIDAMFLPESAVAVQGMKNFVRQFAAVADSKRKDEDDDKHLRNIASVVNGQIRSSYESLSTKNSNSNSISGDAQGQGRPDWDRRSLESFLYGQVKTVIDSTLDRIIGNGTAPPSPNSPFLMTQSSFDKRLEELQFLQPSHLELTCLNDDSSDSTSQTKLEILLEGPVNALQSMESFYSPYEKLCKVLDIYHGVNAVLKTESKALPMADDVISAMILVIVKAAKAQNKSKINVNTKAFLKNLLRDLHFVENFALQEYKRVGGGEVEYAFTSLYGAVYFLQGVELDFDREESDGGNKSSTNRLYITNDELRRGLEKSRALAANNHARGMIAADRIETPKGLISQGVIELLGGSNHSGVVNETSNLIPNPRQLSVREVRAARLRGETTDLEWALGRKQIPEEGSKHNTTLPFSLPTPSPSKSTPRSVFLPQRHTFLGARPESIKLSDLPRLLDEYRKLVVANEQLLGEHQRANNKIQQERKRLRDEQQRRTLGEQALLG